MATVAIANDQDVVTAEIFIAAPPARVFADPADEFIDPSARKERGPQDDKGRLYL